MSIPARMTAIAIREPGAPDVLVPQERDTPQPKAGEIGSRRRRGREPAGRHAAEGARICCLRGLSSIPVWNSQAKW